MGIIIIQKNSRGDIVNRGKGILKKILLSVLIIILIGLGAFYIYTLNYYHAEPEAFQALENSQVEFIQKKDMVVFTSANTISDKALIFYPGGKVEYLSYIPLMEKIANEGYICFLLKMPFNLAVFKQNAADKPINDYPDIKNWYLSGHSLGGAMASVYASKNIEKVEGLILLGAYPSADLSVSALKMISIYGSEDKILNRQSFEENKSYGPKDSKYIEIKGGNHAFYGSYGQQNKDGIATITAQEQQDLTAEKILEFMNK